VTTSRTDEPTAAPPPVTVSEAGGHRTGTSLAVRRGVSVFVVFLAALPALLGLGDVLRDEGKPYSLIGDAAILALNVDAVGEQDVLLGAFSRFGWYHPGPMITYLLAVPYHLMDGATESLAVGALVVGAISSAAAVWLVRRRAGLLVAAWTLLVLTVSVRLLGADFLRDSWNPHVSVLPLLAGALLCWTAIRGDAWALPVAVVPLSLALQSHLGYLPPVGAICAVLGVGLVVRAVRRVRTGAGGTEPPRRPVRWLVAGVSAVPVALLVWWPPLKEELTVDPGNISKLVDYMREGSPEETLSVPTALRAVADEFGRLPAYAVGVDLPRLPFIPYLVPPVAIAVGVALFVVAVVNGLRRRRADVLWLGALTLAVAAAAVAAVARVDGPPYYYLTRWTVVIGILAWTTVGLSLLPELAGAVRRMLPGDRPASVARTVLGVPLVALATAAVLVTGLGTARAQTPMTEVTGDLERLGQAVVDDLDRLGLRTESDAPAVRVDFAPTTRDELLGTYWSGCGLALELQRAGVDVQINPFFVLQFGERRTERYDDAGYVATFAYSDGTSPPPEPWQQLLAVGDEYQVYGGVPPVG